jgi:hypothetical protein
MSETNPSRSVPLLTLGGGLGIAACFIGLAIFFGGCFGLSAIFMLCIVPMGLSAVGLVLSIAGPLVQKTVHVEDPAVFAAIFINILGIVGSLLLMSAWLGWRLLP